MRLLPPLAACLALALLAGCGPDDGAGVRDVPAQSDSSESGSSGS